MVAAAVGCMAVLAPRLCASTDTENGSVGTPGTPGNNATSGGPGGNGGQAVANAITNDQTNTATATGGSGGDGGNGFGNGTGSGGGNGGNGARGSANVGSVGTFTSTNGVYIGNFATGIGGNGGNGGTGAIAQHFQGVGGNGGNGSIGAAVALISAMGDNFFNLGSVGLQAMAVGGNGGAGGGRDGSGGFGGSASLGTVQLAVTNSSSAFATAMTLGGNGGAGTGAGNGGNGASQALNNAITVSANNVGNSLFQNQGLYLYQVASGGNGGASGTGVSGSPGFGSAISNNTFTTSAIGTLTVENDAYAGNGGDSQSTGAVAGGTAMASTTLSSGSNIASTYAIANANGQTGSFTNTTHYGTGNGGNVTAGSGTGGAGGAAMANSVLQTTVSTGFATIFAAAQSSAVGGNGGSVTGSAFGTGGAGGTASATATASNTGNQNITATASATGGSGGQAQGVGFVGGAGASINVSTVQGTATSSGGGVATAVYSATGGTGGAGSSGASAGNGGSVFVTNAVSGSTTSVLYLTQQATGGNAGFLSGTAAATAPLAGAATSVISKTNTQALTSTSVTVNALGGIGGGTDAATAGNGGSANASLTYTTRGALTAVVTANTDSNHGAAAGGSATLDASGGKGGNGIASLNVSSSDGSAVNATVTSYGGKGGMGNGAGFSGGNGGTPQFGTVVANSAGAVNLSVIAVGGNGGRAFMGANGGAGAAATLSNAGVVPSATNASYDQEAYGGNGDLVTDGGTGGAGGSASSLYSNTFLGASPAVSVLAQGGFASAIGDTSGNVGGSANSNVSISAAGTINIQATSTGGEGSILVFDATNLASILNGGNGGMATATAFGTNSSTVNSAVTVKATATGGAGGTITSNNGSGGSGSSATATAFGSGAGTNTVEADGTARGGSGTAGQGAGLQGGNGGSANANATSINTHGYALANAMAFGGSGGTATQGATAGLAGASFASANATGLNSADAFVTASVGSTGNAAATATANATGLFSFIRSNAVAPLEAGGAATSHASVATAAPSSFINGTKSTVAYAIGSPTGSDVVAAWSNSANTRSAFNSSQSNVWLLGQTAEQYSSAGSGTTRTISTSIEVNQNNAQLTSNGLVVGLLADATGFNQQIGTGDSLRFRVVRQGSALIDRTFTDTASFTSYFSNSALLLGVQNAGVNGANLDLQLLFDFTSSHPGAGVGVELLAGTNSTGPGGIWNNSGGGTWGTPTNWTSNALPTGPGVTATFGSAITAPSTVNVDGSVTVGSLVFNNSNAYTLSGSNITLDNGTNPTSVTLTSGNHTISSSVLLNSDANVTVNSASNTLTLASLNAGGKNLTKAGAGRLAIQSTGTYGSVMVSAGVLNFGDVTNGVVSPLNISGTLNVSDGASMVLLPANGMAVTHTINTLNLNTTGKLDIGNSSFYTTTSTSTIQSYLKAGYNGGAWNGSGAAIVSTSANLSSGSSTRSLGYASSTDSVAGSVIIPAGQTLVKYTTPGDADLSGNTDFNDFLALQNAYNKPGNWSQGDFDYTGTVDFNDFLILQNNYNHNLNANGTVAGGSAKSALAKASSLTASPSVPTATVTYVLSPNDDGHGNFAAGKFAVYAIDSTADGNHGMASFSVDVQGATLVTNFAPKGTYDDGTNTGNTVAEGFTLLRTGNGAFSTLTDPAKSSQDTVDASGVQLIYGMGQLAGNLNSQAPAGSSGGTGKVQPTYAAELLVMTGTFSGSSLAFNTDMTFDKANVFLTGSTGDTEAAGITLTTAGVPEPTTLSLMALAAGGLLGRRKRRR